MTTKRQIEDAVQAWMVGNIADVGVVPSDVRPADQGSTQPPRAFSVVRVESYDNAIGIDEVVQATHPTTGAPLQVTRGWRTAEVTVTTFGAGAEDWIRRACARLSLPVVQAELAELGFDIDPVSPIVNRSAVRQTHSEAQAQRAFQVSYVQCSTLDEAAPLTELGTVQAELQLRDDDGAPVLTETATIPL